MFTASVMSRESGYSVCREETALATEIDSHKEWIHAHSK